MRNLVESQDMEAAYGTATRKHDSRCGVVLSKVPPKAQRAEPRTHASPMFRTLVDVRYPYPIRREKRPQRREGPTQSRGSSRFWCEGGPAEWHITRYSQEKEEREGRNSDQCGPYRDGEGLQPPLPRDLRRREPTHPHPCHPSHRKQTRHGWRAHKKRESSGGSTSTTTALEERAPVSKRNSSRVPARDREWGRTRYGPGGS